MDIENCVYFISNGKGAIKIGSAMNLRKRLNGLQTSNPDKLEVLAAIPALGQEEFDLHQKFAHLRLNGEWFRAEPELLTFIDALPKEPVSGPMPETPAPIAPREMRGSEFDAIRRKLTPLRNSKTLDFAGRQRLTTILSIIQNINSAAREPEYREKLIGAFKQQFAEFEQHIAATTALSDVFTIRGGLRR